MGFLSRLWGGIKNVAKKGARLVSKIAKPVVKVAKKVLPMLSLVPGAVGNVARVANTGLSLADNAINQLPSGKLKDKLQDISGNAANKVASTHEKAADVAQQVKKYADTGQQYMKAGENAVNTIKSKLPQFSVCRSGLGKRLAPTQAQPKPQVVQPRATIPL